jgi:hypothetical protein
MAKLSAHYTSDGLVMTGVLIIIWMMANHAQETNLDRSSYSGQRRWFQILSFHEGHLKQRGKIPMSQPGGVDPAILCKMSRP